MGEGPGQAGRELPEERDQDRPGASCQRRSSWFCRLDSCHAENGIWPNGLSSGAPSRGGGERRKSTVRACVPAGGQAAAGSSPPSPASPHQAAPTVKKAQTCQLRRRRAGH